MLRSKTNRRHTKKRKHHHLQTGRGADLESIPEPDPNQHPFVQKVLGRGGFGIVIGMPRLPLESEYATYRKYDIGKKLKPLIGVSLSFDEYTSACEEIVETITNPDARALFLKLCFEAQKFYKPNMSDSMFMEHIDLVMLSSFKNMLDELREVDGVYNGFDTPEKKEILKNVAILPIIESSEIGRLHSLIKSSRYTEFTDELFKGSINPDEYLTNVHLIIPPSVRISKIDYISDLYPSDLERVSLGPDKDWTFKLFEQIVDLFGIHIRDNSITQDDTFDFDMIGDGDDFYEMIKKFKYYRRHPSPRDSLLFLSNLFTCMTFPLARESLRSIVKTLGGQGGADPSQRGTALAKSLDEMIPFANNLLTFYEQGFVHNDLKTDNVIIDLTGNLKFIDFGGVASTKTPKHNIKINIGSFEYPFWSLLNVIRPIMDRMVVKFVDITTENFNKVVPKIIDAKKLEEILKRVSLGILKTSAVESLENYLKDKKNFTKIIESIKILRNTIIDSYLLDPQLKTGKIKDTRKIENVIITSFATLLETTKSPDTGEVNPIRLREEVTLRNDVYSLGIIFVEYVNSLASFILLITSATGKTNDKLVRYLYEFLRFAAACMSISNNVSSSVWLPKLKDLANEISTTLEDKPSISVSEIKEISEMLPIEFPLSTTSLVMTNEQKSSRLALQGKMLSGFLTRPLTSMEDYTASTDSIPRGPDDVAVVGPVPSRPSNEGIPDGYVQLVAPPSLKEGIPDGPASHHPSSMDGVPDGYTSLVAPPSLREDIPDEFNQRNVSEVQQLTGQLTRGSLTNIPIDGSATSRKHLSRKRRRHTSRRGTRKTRR